jgi:hypothetical protein
MFKRKIKLPVTPQEYDRLVSLLVKKYKLKDAHHAAAILSIAIRHLPAEKYTTTLDYLGHYILKNIANHVADHKSKILQHEAQIDHLVYLLTQDPLDTQARDSLEKAASEGSDYATQALLRPEIQNLTPALTSN